MIYFYLNNRAADYIGVIGSPINIIKVIIYLYVKNNKYATKNIEKFVAYYLQMKL